jgi:LytR cell envelope-related transcriptional attenuator
VINASGQDGVAVAVRNALAKGQFTQGTVSTADSIRTASSSAYGISAQSAAELLAGELGLSAIASDAVAPDSVLLTVGTDFSHLRVRRQARRHIGRHHNERGATPHHRTGDSRWQ